MQTKTILNSIALAVASVHEDGGWLCGTVTDRDTRHHPLVPDVTMRGSVPYLLSTGNLASAAAPVFLPHVGPMNLFREIHADALDEFMRLKKDPAEACGFIKKTGVFSLSDLTLRRKPALPRHVAKWWKGLPEKSIPFAMDLDVFWEDRGLLAAALELWQAVVERDEQTALHLCEIMAPPLVGKFTRSINVFDLARFYLALVVARGLSNTRFSAVESAGQIVPGVVTAAVRDAMFLRLMTAVSDGEELRKCERNGCGARFAPGPHDRVYCSEKCKDADKYQKRKARLSAAAS